MRFVQEHFLTEQDPTALSHQRKKKLLHLTASIILLALLYLFYWFFYARYFEETDNAYVNGNVVPISAQINGNIIAIDAEDTDFVEKGQALVHLDKTDNQIALANAKAVLAQTLRQTEQLYINNHGLLANITSRQSDLDNVSQELSRRQKIISAGAISQEELTNMEDRFYRAKASLTQAQADWEANRALIENTSISAHPMVKKATSDVRRAYLDYVRTSIYSPVAGFVAKRSAELGQRIAPGQVLMAVVPLDEVWVDANFKEKQLGLIQPGQAVILSADMYGKKVIYHGRVLGFSAGTGAAFSLLPAQNATGNWIKIVQRLPVRIALEKEELRAHPLRIGLSMEVRIDRRKPLAIPKPISHQKTDVFNVSTTKMDAMIATIVAQNVIMSSFISSTETAFEASLPQKNDEPT